MAVIATNTEQIQTINPATFSLGGGSRDQSPAMMQATMFNNSPNAVFSASSEDSNETFNANQNFNMGQNPAWDNGFGNQYTSPGALHFTPSPNGNATPSVNGRGSGAVRGRSNLHIAPISTKSRVETQINVIMTLEKPPPNTDYLHLPLHTIAKSKLLAKEEVDTSKALELHTMLVCTSAMRNPELKEKALQRAGAQNNMEIQRRAEQARDNPEEDRNDLKNIPEDDKPSNGGEVRICNNCIQRERKRAGRKKLKKEEEQQHWERYETERVVVFNSNEFLSFKSYEPGQQHQKDNGLLADDYVPPEGSMHVTAAMRIACYCRHQSEKEGFQVIFTMKDQEGNIIAQEMSDSILITDDHKTHPPSFSAQVPEQMLYGQVYAHGLPTSYSMVDMSAHMQTGFPSSRSTGNLQALGGYGQQFNPQSHLHQLQNSGFNSATTSATMTPTSLSRPGSPTNAGNAGPNKKRKSSSFHRKVPSGLAMTPRVDTSQGQPGNAQAGGMPMNSPFSPVSAGFNGQTDQSYMTIPTNGGPAQFIASGPNTPAMENTPFNFSQGPPGSRGMNPQDSYYHSAPGSRVGSRAPSPVGANRVNLAAYARQQMAPSQPPPRQQVYPQHQPQPQQHQQQAQSMPGSSGNDPDPTTITPMIHKISPSEGPTTGGTEVSVYGRNFTPGCQIYFGEQPATGLTFYGDQALLCVTPPGRIGAVHVSVVAAGNVPQYSPAQANKPIFSYKNSNERMMEMALRYLSQQQTGNPNNWFQVAQSKANDFMTSNVGRAGLGQGFDGGNMLSAGPATLEDTIAKIFEIADSSVGPHSADLDMLSGTGESLLSLASSIGLHRVVVNLLARGANQDVRDASGWTPLMHAALQGHVEIFRLLTAKGADPAIRSLSGFSACGVAPSKIREELYNILLDTERTVSRRRPQLRSYPSTLSVASSTPSWDIKSASSYESEADSIPSTPLPKQDSAQSLLSVVGPSHGAVGNATAAFAMATAAAAPPPACDSPDMEAWRSAIASQMVLFQASMQARIPHLALRLPSLADVPEHYSLRRVGAIPS